MDFKNQDSEIKNLNRSLSHDSNKSMDEVLKKKTKKKTRRWIFRRKKKCKSPVLKSYQQNNNDQLEDDICNITEQGAIDKGRENSVDLSSLQCIQLNPIGNEPTPIGKNTIQKPGNQRRGGFAGLNLWCGGCGYQKSSNKQEKAR